MNRAMLFIAIGIASIANIFAWSMKSKTPVSPSAQTTNWQWNNDWGANQPQVPTKTQDPVTPPVQQQDDKQIVATDHENAMKLSEETGLPVLIYFEASWCQWCKKMKNETLANAAVKEVMKKFVVLYVDTDSNRDLATKYNIKSLPSSVIIDSKEMKTKTASGYMDAKSFAKWLTANDRKRLIPEIGNLRQRIENRMQIEDLTPRGFRLP